MIAKLKKRGFTLVELMIVVAIVGVLAALAIYGVRKYIANAKTAEARNAVGQMAKDAAAAYAREGMASAILAAKGSTGITNHLCPNAAAPVPAGAAPPPGKKYQSDPGEWSDNAGWSCLRFSMADPQYYQYNYTASGTTGAANETFAAVARGDLNADGKNFSTFELDGKITDTSGRLEVFVSPNMTEIDPEE